MVAAAAAENGHVENDDWKSGFRGILKLNENRCHLKEAILLCQTLDVTP